MVETVSWSSPHPTDNDVLYAEAEGGQAGRYNKKTGIAKDIKPYQEKNGPKLPFQLEHAYRTKPENKADRFIWALSLFTCPTTVVMSGNAFRPIWSTNDPKRQRQGLDGETKPHRWFVHRQLFR